jgi:hypothetical protein
MKTFMRLVYKINDIKFKCVDFQSCKIWIHGFIIEVLYVDFVMWFHLEMIIILYIMSIVTNHDTSKWNILKYICCKTLV